MSLKIALWLSPAIGLCAGVVLEFFPPVTAARLFTKDKYLEQMFGDNGQARTKAGIWKTDNGYNLKVHLHKTPCCAFVPFIGLLINHKILFFQAL